MIQNYSQRPLSVEDICRKLKPIFGKKIDEIYLRYATAENPEARNDIVHVLNMLYTKYLNKLLEQKVLLEPPAQNVIDGDYSLADVSYAGKKLFPFTLREKDWPRHVCVSGMSGSGKTTLAFKIIESFIKHNKNFLVFDWKKSFRPLLLSDKEIMLFTVGNDAVSNLLKMNINEPPRGVAPQEWINVLCDLLVESFFVSFGVHKILLETLDEAFREWGVYAGSKNYPTWNHIKWRLEQKIDKTRGREAMWLESALRIATVLTFGDFGKSINYKGEDRVTIDEIIKKKVILEMNSLGNIEKKFFCEFVLTYIYKYKKANFNKIGAGSVLKDAILVDEAHNIFLKDKTKFVNESVTDMIYREMREYGTSLICLDQHISKLSDTVKGNSACHIAFQQQLPQDIFDVSDLMQLRDRKEMFSQLPVGTAIVKLSERYSSPFLVEVPYVELRKYDVSDDKVKARMELIMNTKDFEANPQDKFNQALLGKIVLKKPIVEESQVYQESKPTKVCLSDTIKVLNDTQLQIMNEVKRRLSNFDSLVDIERALTRGDLYKHTDVIKVINYVFEEQLSCFDKLPMMKSPVRPITKYPLNVTTIEKQNIYKASQNVTSADGMSEEQVRFITFLRENPEHELATTKVYKKVKLSPRKGNAVKEELTAMGLIKVHPIKYEKGWKKIIRLN